LYRSILAATLTIGAIPASAGLREAVEYLEEEVPRWKRENKCYSCHNNGDGARALLALRAAGVDVKAEALADSLENVRSPAGWEKKTLALVQYAAAMREAARTGLIEVPAQAIEMLLRAQEEDGRWKVDEEMAEGAATTYGSELATALAIEAIGKENEAVAGARRWLERRKPGGIVAAAGVLLAGVSSDAAVNLLLARQVADGSWNHEAFDTAVAMLALERAGKGGEEIRRGREYLLTTQLSGGGWTGTTRPAGGTSYAQHISTTAWAAMALSATEARRQ
jgi:hypothetical protein